MSSYFPDGSGSGDTKARTEIWINFDDFTALARTNESRAKRLITAAKSGDQGAMMAGVKNLGGSCKACHKLYKDKSYSSLTPPAKIKPVATV